MPRRRNCFPSCNRRSGYNHYCMKPLNFLAGAALLSLFLFTSACSGGESTGKENQDKPTEEKPLDDASAVAKRISDFYNWYGPNLEKFMSFGVVKTNETYRVNFEESEKMLAFLQASGHFHLEFIDGWRTWFKGRDEHFQKSKQKEGPPEGFEKDPFTNSQGGDATIKKLAEAKWNISISGNTAVAESGPVEESPGMKLTLKKDGSNWTISKVE
jgi:hypothetical protein